MVTNKQILCKCGCGTSIEPFGTRGKPKLYVKGHTVRYLNKHFFKGRHLSNERKKLISLVNTGHNRMCDEKRRFINLGRKHSPETLEKIRLAGLGRKHSIETRVKQSVSKRGEKSYLWKGGITPINKVIRMSVEYKLWREAVFKRDGYTCIWCGQRGGRLNADHIKPFSSYPELRFAIDNGRTLCIKCHKTTDTYGSKAKENFL